MDLTHLDVNSDTKQITVRLGVRDLGQADPLGSVGVQYDVRATVAERRIHLDAIVDVTGQTFYAFIERLDEGTGEPATVQAPGKSVPIRGRVDVAKDTITLTAPLSAFDFSAPLQKGRKITSWYAASYRMGGTYATGGANFPGDHFGTKRVHLLGETPCGRLTPAT